MQRGLAEVTVLDKQGVIYRIFPSRRLKGVGVEWSSLLIRHLKQALRQEPALIHIHGLFWPMSYYLISAFSSYPMVVSEYLNHLSMCEKLLRRLRTKNPVLLIGITLLHLADAITQRVVLGKVDKIIVLNRLQRRYFARFVGDAKVEVIPVGTDFDRFKPMGAIEARQRLGLKADAKYILYVGAMVQFKGLEYLLQAYARVVEEIPEAILLMAGDGPLRRKLEESSRKLGIGDGTRFVGYVDNEQLPLWCNAADVCVLPSWNEALGLTGVEALACERPYIATRVGGIPEVVETFKAGYLVEPRDPSALAEAIIQVLRMPQAFHVDRINGEKSYDWKYVARRFIDVYERVAPERLSTVHKL